MKKLFVLAAALALSGAALAAAPKSAKTLTAGKYSAHVKALVCEGCASNIQDTLKGFKAIDGVSVDQPKSQLSFEVKKGKTVSVAKLQKALKASADQMGMGADYSLQNITAAK